MAKGDVVTAKDDSVTATLLIADDDPVARDLLAEVLTHEGYRVVTAPSGEECVRPLEAEPFDLLIVDLGMCDVEAGRLLERLRAQHPELPIVTVITFASADTVNEAVRAGASDSLSKPFRMKEIALVVRRALDTERWTRRTLTIVARSGSEIPLGVVRSSTWASS